MVFLEASLFTKYLRSRLSDEEYRLFQKSLLEHPDSGDIIKGSGGIRKVRWKAGGKGKNEKENLSAVDLKRIKEHLEAIEIG